MLVPTNILKNWGWVITTTMWRWVKTEGSHLLIFPLVLNPCKHSILNFAPFSMYCNCRNGICVGWVKNQPLFKEFNLMGKGLFQPTNFRLIVGLEFGKLNGWDLVPLRKNWKIHPLNILICHFDPFNIMDFKYVFKIITLDCIFVKSIYFSSIKFTST